jgi:Coenzyme PQQ synthesis protein D (PqqD)
MASNRIPQAHGRFLLEEMDGESFAYRPPAGQGIYLNETATVIWKLCDGTRSVQQIVELLVDTYPGAADEVLVDVSDTIDNLMRIGALKMVDSPAILPTEEVNSPKARQG